MKTFYPRKMKGLALGLTDTKWLMSSTETLLTHLCLCPSSLPKYSLGHVYPTVLWPRIIGFSDLLCADNPLVLFIKDYLKQLIFQIAHILVSINESLYYKIANCIFSKMLRFSFLQIFLENWEQCVSSFLLLFSKCGLFTKLCWMPRIQKAYYSVVTQNNIELSSQK